MKSVTQMILHAPGAMMCFCPKNIVSASAKAAMVMSHFTISRPIQTEIAVLPWVESCPVTAMWELIIPVPVVTAGAAMVSP